MPNRAIRRAFVPQAPLDFLFWMVFLSTVIGIAWQLLDHYPPYTLLSRTAENSPAPGEFLRVRIVDRVNYPAAIMAHRTIYDSTNLRYEYGDSYLRSSGEAGTVNTFVVLVPIPMTAAPGKASLVTRACWKRPYNVFHRVWPVCENVPVLEFNISEKGKAS